MIATQRLAIVRARIMDLPSEEQAKIMACAMKISDLIRKNPESGCLAVSLVTLELQAAQE